MKQADMDQTVFLNLGQPKPAPDLPASFRPVATSGMDNARNASIPYVAQQTSVSVYSHGLNPLVSAASELLLSIVHIRAESKEETHGQPDDSGQSLYNENLEHMRARLEAEIRAFESRALASADIEQAQIIASRYVLCTAVDETISTSLPGENGEWSKHGLLSTFHNETWGGEKFFQILDRCMQQPARNLYILELMYLLLSLGFEGKFGVKERGPIALEALRDKVYKQIRLLRGEPPQDLAEKVEPPKERPKIYAYIPIWLVLAIFLFAMGVTFIGFSTILEKHAEPLLDNMARVAGSFQEVKP